MLTFRTARRADLATLVGLLADDPLGARRETPEQLESYQAAFDAIRRDPHQRLIVAELDGAVAGFLQLTLIPYLTYRGGWRGLIEGVRVRADLRGRGVGRALLEHAIELARQHPCHLVQLTTDKQRPAALRFYESLGFRSTHEGMKLHLPPTPAAED